MVSKIGNNEKCPCGSGHKFKKCCGKIRPKQVSLIPATTLRLTATQMVICLLRQLGGNAVVELEEVAGLDKGVRIDIEQKGNSMHLSVSEVEVEKQGVILTPETNIIT